MDRLLRITALALCGATLIWLAGCGGPAGSSAEDDAPKSSLAAEIESRNAEQAANERDAAATAAAARREQLVNEPPSEITKDDFKKGSTVKQGGRLNQALGGVLAAGEDIQLANARHQLEIQANIDGWPESHEAFMKLLDGWGMKLPPLVEPYEYWYDAQTHTILKRPFIEDGSADE